MRATGRSAPRSLIGNAKSRRAVHSLAAALTFPIVAGLGKSGSLQCNDIGHDADEEMDPELSREATNALEEIRASDLRASKTAEAAATASRRLNNDSQAAGEQNADDQTAAAADAENDEEAETEAAIRALPEDVRKALDAAGQVGDLNVTVELEHESKLNKTLKFTRPWNITHFCQMATDFESREFRDQLIVYEMELKAFKQAWLADPHRIVNDFEGALQALDGMKQNERLLRLFDFANVYSYNSEEKRVNMEGMANFKALRNRERETVAAMADFEQTLRNVEPEKMRALQDSVAGRKFRPWIRALRGTYAVPLEQQIAAESFAASADSNYYHGLQKVQLTVDGKSMSVTEVLQLADDWTPEEAATKLGPTLKQQLAAPAMEELMKHQRWNAYRLALEPASIASPKDRYSLINQKLGLDAKTALAIRESVDSGMRPLWERYCTALHRLAALMPGRGEKPLTFNSLVTSPAVPYARAPREMEAIPWQEMEIRANNAVRQLSPMLGAMLPKLRQEERVLWDKSLNQKMQKWDFSSHDGGREAGPIVHIEVTDGGEDCYVAPAATALAEAALCKIKNHEALYVPSRPWFTQSMMSQLSEELTKDFSVVNMNKAGPRASFALRVLFRGLNCLAYSNALNKYEDEVNAACDALGEPTSVSMKNPVMPDLKRLAEGWERSITWLNVSGKLDCTTVAKLPILRHGAVPHQIIAVFGDWYNAGGQNGQYRLPLMNNSIQRHEWQTMVRILTDAAVFDALHDDNGNLIPLIDRDRVIGNIAVAPAQYNFSAMIAKVLQGEPENPKYWTRILEKCFGHYLTVLEQSLTELEKDPKLQKIRETYAALQKLGLNDAANSAEIATADAGGETAAA